MLPAASAIAAPATVTSPDGKIAFQIEEDASRFSVARGGKALISASPLGLDFDGAPALGVLGLEAREDARMDRNIALVASKASTARDHFHGATLVFKERAGAGRRLLIDVRAYDDGVAFRYRIEGTEPVRLRGERTAFIAAGDPECLVSAADGAHEVPFESVKFSRLLPGKAYDVPVVCSLPAAGTTYAITQAGLAGYTGAALVADSGALRVRLSAPPKRPAPAYVSQGGLTTAWRAVMIGNRPGDLIGSHLVGNLNPPPEGTSAGCGRARRHGTGGRGRWRA